MECDHCFNQGIHALGQNNPELAFTCFERVVKLYPEHDMAWSFLALLLGNTDVGRACLDKAIRINPLNKFAMQLKRLYKEQQPDVPNQINIHIDNRQVYGLNSGANREKVYYNGRIPFKAVHFSHSFLWHLLLGWHIGIIFSLLEQQRLHLKITSYRILFLYGLYGRQQVDFELYRVREVMFRQSVLQRFFNCGHVIVHSGENDEQELVFPMTKPRRVCNCIRQAIRAQRRDMRTLHWD